MVTETLMLKVMKQIHTEGSPSANCCRYKDANWEAGIPRNSTAK